MGIEERQTFMVTCDRCGAGELIWTRDYPYKLHNGWTLVWVESHAVVRCPNCARLVGGEPAPETEDADGQP